MAAMPCGSLLESGSPQSKSLKTACQAGRSHRRSIDGDDAGRKLRGPSTCFSLALTGLASIPRTSVFSRSKPSRYTQVTAVDLIHSASGADAAMPDLAVRFLIQERIGVNGRDILSYHSNIELGAAIGRLGERIRHLVDSIRDNLFGRSEQTVGLQS
jgi:hypothetical protein